MTVKSCIPIIPSFDLERSLRFWRDGLGFDDTWWEERRDGKLIGCGLRKGQLSFMLNQRRGRLQSPDDHEGIRFYWAPDDLAGLHSHLRSLGYNVSDIAGRDYGQNEFVVTDDDGFSHCFGVPVPDPD